MKVVLTLYKFVKLANCDDIRHQLWSLMNSQSIKGTIILAPEGINGTVAGERHAINELKDFFANDERFLNLEAKESSSMSMPFKKLKISIKKEIVTMKQPQVDPTALVGTYVDAKRFNDLINNENVTVIDVRNNFEVEMGTFKGAINPNTAAFSDFPEFVKNHLSPKSHPIIAMACTGGIRCEKASSYMIQMGFKEVYHLKGGILQYLKDMPQAETAWQGDCFVFDERIALDHNLSQIATSPLFNPEIPRKRD